MQDSEELLNLVPVFEPKDWFVLVFDFISVCVTAYYFFLIPIEYFVWEGVGKLATRGKLFSLSSSIIFVLIFIADLILQFNVGFFENGILVKDR